MQKPCWPSSVTTARDDLCADLEPAATHNIVEERLTDVAAEASSGWKLLFQLVYLFLSNDVFRREKKLISRLSSFFFFYCCCCYSNEGCLRSFISQSFSFLAEGVCSPELSTQPPLAVQNRRETCFLLIGQWGAPRKCGCMKVQNENAVNPGEQPWVHACSKSPAIFYRWNAHKFGGGATVRHVDTSGWFSVACRVHAIT